MEHEIRQLLDQLTTVKVFVAADILFHRPSPLDSESTQETSAGFRTEPVIIYSMNDVDVDDIANQLTEQIDNFNRRGSGWLFTRILKFSLGITPYRPLAGSGFFETPDYIKNKKAVVNIICYDEQCFLHCLSAFLHPVDSKSHPNEVRHYLPYVGTYNVQGLTFPLTLDQIPKFENRNPDFAIVVISHDEENGFVPVFVSKNQDRKHRVHLLLLSDEDSGQQHYTLIKSLSRLVADRTKHNGKTFICERCLLPFSSEDVLSRHIELCRTHNPQTVAMPTEHHMSFSAYGNMFTVPFCIYYDFESFLVPSDEEGVVAEHVPSGYCAYRVSIWEQFRKPPTVYSGRENVVQNFFEHMFEEEKEMQSILSTDLPMRPMTPDEKRLHRASETCSVCEHKFDNRSTKFRKTAHHCHVTGEPLGAVCNRCNQQLKFTRQNRGYVIPVIAHNSKNYDATFILRNYRNEFFPTSQITVIPSNTEKFLAFTIGTLRFIDSCQFLPASLDNLVGTLLKAGKDKFPNVLQHLGDCDLVFRKGVYPYEYVTGPDKFQETELPPKEAFYSALTEDVVSDDDYARAHEAWQKFQCTTLQDFHDLYLKTDVLLLADVFEHFREQGRQNFKLDAAHYFTLPGFGWDAALKTTEVELELIKDVDTYMFFECGIRGGISMISNRYAKANNRYLKDEGDYRRDLASKFIAYFDANNLYGWGMCSSLPTGDFRFLDETEVADFDAAAIPEDGPKGYVLQVDMDYPDSLHDLHNDYPMAPEKIAIDDDMLSPYAKAFNHKGKPPVKLVPNLMPKTNYVLHLRNLQLYLKHGLRLVKIHKILEFSQDAWLKPYVELCTRNRQQAKTETEKNFWKLLVNSVFGKSMENVRNRVNVRLVTDPLKVKKLTAKPTYKRFRIINEDLVMIEMQKAKLVLNKPIYTGFSILEISKILMYRFHYEHVLARYGDKAALLFTDTDSLCYSIETPDLYKDMEAMLDIFDTSNFEVGHALRRKDNENVLGKFKSETGSLAPSEFVGLRPKMYSLLLSKADKPKITAKGVKRGFVSKHVKHEQFVETLRSRVPTTAKFHAFRSTAQVMRTLEVSKLCLSAYDDKRYLLADGYHSYAYGHFRIRD